MPNYLINECDDKHKYVEYWLALFIIFLSTLLVFVIIVFLIIENEGITEISILLLVLIFLLFGLIVMIVELFHEEDLIDEKDSSISMDEFIILHEKFQNKKDSDNYQ